MTTTSYPPFLAILASPTARIGLVTVLALLGLICYRILFHPLAKIPGPFLAKFTDHWRNIRVWRGTWHDDILQIHERYGRAVRIAPNEVAIVDQSAMKQLYGHGQNAQKTDWYATWDPPIGAPAFFSVRERKLHSYLRKRVSSAFSMTAILKYEQPIQSLLDLLFQKLKAHADAGNTIDMSQWTNAFAFDVVGILGFGAPLGHLEAEQDVMNIRSSVLELFFWSMCMGHYWGQVRLLRNRFIETILGLFGGQNRLQRFQDWSVSRVQERLEEREKGIDHSDMLEHFTNMKRADGGPATFAEVLAEALNLVYVNSNCAFVLDACLTKKSGAGADTTSIAMRSCLEAVCSRPEVYRRLQTEVDEFYNAHNLAEPATYLQTQQLPYLNAVAKEAMRLRPSIVYQLLRIAPEQGLTVDGKWIPPTTPVGISALAQNRDKAIWGADANEFRPQRWLEDEAKTRFLDSNNMTFGGNGPRMCIGRNIALVRYSIPRYSFRFQ